MRKDLSYLDESKIFAHLDRVEEWLNKGITKPIMIEIDPTNLCNGNCPNCAGNRLSPRASLSLDFMKKFIDEVSPFLKGLVFTGGGEPLMNKDVIETVIYARKKGIDIGFITNGELLNKEKAEKLVSFCTWIRISLDADNKEDYALVHGLTGVSYNKVLENLKLLINIKKKCSSKCTLGVGYLTNRMNSNKMLSFSKNMKKLGVDYVQFRPFHFDNFDVAEIINQCKKLESINFKILISQQRYDKNEYDYPIAFRDEFTTVVAADGKLYPCCFTRGIKDFELGDLNKDSFEKIWNSKRKKDILANKLNIKTCPIMCKQDKLSQTLWDILRLNKEGNHLNFI